MKLGHIDRDGQPALFAENDTHWIVVADHLLDGPKTLDQLVEDPAKWLPAISEAIGSGEPVSSRPSRVLAPFHRPAPIIAIGLNYSDHCREFGVEPPKAPVVFVKLAPSVIGDGAPIEWAEGITKQVDWEAELGVVIGREARGIGVHEALDYVFGYTVINDVTARDIQASEQQWVRAKSLNTFCPIGPVVVTTDEIADPSNLGIRSRVNGVVMQDSNTSELIFSVAQLVSYLSHSFTLNPGDIIATGTPLGVGAFRTPPRFLNHGDVVEVEVDGIGLLSNTCQIQKEG